MKILITGGAGYIGSTVCSALLDAGHTPIILDSLVTGCKKFVEGQIFYYGDIADYAVLKKICTEHPDINCCMHFAARIVISESVSDPHLYYKENVIKSISLFKSLQLLGIKRVIFSGSASVYQSTPNFEVTEESPTQPSNPYAKTKLIMEMAMEDFCSAGHFKGIALRYFNPIGSDRQMRTGPFIAQPTHILGKLVESAYEENSTFYIMGTDWQTRDGSAMRDYIHIWDLALAHVAAAERFDQVFETTHEDFSVINLGSGNGVTVKEFVQAFKNVFESPIKIANASRRAGDAVGAFANCEKAKTLLGWSAKYSIEDGIRDALAWNEHKNTKLQQQK